MRDSWNRIGWHRFLTLRGESTKWNLFAESLLSSLSQRFDALGASVGHVKLMIETGNSFVIGNITDKGDTLSIRGSAETGSEARLTINTRVQMSPVALETIVRESIVSTSKGRLTSTPVTWSCLSPERPNPTHRYDHVVTINET